MEKKHGASLATVRRVEQILQRDGLLRIPFAAHSCVGAVVDVVTGDGRLSGAGFRPGDAELAGYVVLDFDAFDAWFGEDERLVVHPREPYHRLERSGSSWTARCWRTAHGPPSCSRPPCRPGSTCLVLLDRGPPDLARAHPEPLHGATELTGLTGVEPSSERPS